MIFETVPELRPKGSSSLVLHLDHRIVATAEATKPNQAAGPQYSTDPYPSTSNRIPSANPAGIYNSPYGVGRGDLEPAFFPRPMGGGSLVGMHSLIIYLTFA